MNRLKCNIRYVCVCYKNGANYLYFYYSKMRKSHEQIMHLVTFKTL